MNFSQSFAQFFGQKNSRIYLDYASATPLDAEVFTAMEPYIVGYIGNASSIYKEGVEAKKILDKARKEIGDVLNTPHDSIIFTSGGTESNNLAIQGTFLEAKKKGIKHPHFITTEIEHSSVLKVFSFLEMQGAKVTYIKPNEHGVVNVQDIKHELTEETVLVSVMMVNNEIGTIQPIKEIARAVKLFKQKLQDEVPAKKNVKKIDHDFPYVHTDASQAIGDIPVSIIQLGIDLLTIDGLKIYGPRGAGVLVKKRSIEISPITFGGGQEFGLRPGTEVIANAVGLAGALKKTIKLAPEETKRILELKNFFETEVKKINFAGKTAIMHGEGENRVTKISNFCVPGIDAEYWTLLLDKKGISISFVSSCQNLNEDSSSYVLKAMEKGECTTSSLRISYGRQTTKNEIEILLREIRGLSTVFVK